MGEPKRDTQNLKGIVHDCFEVYGECVYENEEEEEEIPLNDITECQYEGLLCIIGEHIDTYPQLLEEGKVICESVREQVPEEPRDCDDELKECLDKAEDNDIAVTACETNFVECKLESAK